MLGEAPGRSCHLTHTRKAVSRRREGVDSVQRNTGNRGREAGNCGVCSEHICRLQSLSSKLSLWQCQGCLSSIWLHQHHLPYGICPVGRPTAQINVFYWLVLCISLLRIFASGGTDHLRSPLYALTGIAPGTRLVLKTSLKDHERADFASSRELWAIRDLVYFCKTSWTSLVPLLREEVEKVWGPRGEGSDGVSGLRNGEKVCQSHNTPEEGKEELPFSTTCFYIRRYVGKVASSISFLQPPHELDMTPISRWSECLEAVINFPWVRY